MNTITNKKTSQILAGIKKLILRGFEMDGSEMVSGVADEVKRDAEVVRLLENWYAWNRKREPNKLGYPAAAPYVRLQPQPARRSAAPNVHEAVKIEKIVIKLPEQFKHVITVHYFYQHLPVKTRLQILARLGVPIQRACYYNYLQKAELAVKNNLTAVDKRG